MKQINFLFILLIISQIISVSFCGHIFSHDTEVEYFYEGKPKSYNFNFALESGLNIGNYIEIFMPISNFRIENIEKAEIYPFGQEHLSQRSTPSIISNPQLFFFQIEGENIIDNQWYTLVITPKRNAPIPNLSSKPVLEMRTVSNNVDNDRIIYDQNLSIDYLSISAIPEVETTLIDSYESQAENFNSKAQKKLILTPGNISNLDLMQGVIIIIENTSDSFTFSEICQLNQGPQTLKCQVNQNQANQLYIIYPGQTQITGNIEIDFQVYYPLYYQAADLWVTIHPMNQFQKPVDQVLKRQSVANYFRTIQIQVSIQPYTLLYNIGSNEELELGQNDEKTIPILYSQNHQVFNNIRFPFQVQNSYDNLPHTSLRISVNIQQTVNPNDIKVLPLSINHNLGERSEVQCRQVLAQIICSNIKSLKINFQYWIAAKIAYLSTNVIDNNVNFSDIEINIINDVTKIQLSSSSFIGQKTAPSKNYLQESLQSLDGDWAESLGNTQVISVEEDIQYNADQLYKKAYSENSQGVGVFPEREKEQALIFFLDINLSGFQTFGDPDDDPQRYMLMTLAYNKNIMDFENNYINADNDSLSQKRLSIAAKATGGTHSYFNSVCKDASATTKHLCKNFDDTDASDEHINEQYQDSAGIDYFKFSCKYDRTHCLDLFNGHGGTYVEQVIMAHKAKFKNQFRQSQFLADENQLDFLITFYEETRTNGSPNTFAQIKRGSVLINSYTLSTPNLNNNFKDFSLDFVNYRFNANINLNDFQTYTDSYLRISGNKQDFSPFNKLGVFFDNSLKLASFENPLKDDYVCSVNCKAYNSEIPNNVNYLHNSGIVVHSSDLSQNFDFLAAIQDSSTQWINYIHIVFMDQYDNILQSYVAPISNQKKEPTLPQFFGPTQIPGNSLLVVQGDKDNLHVIERFYNFNNLAGFRAGFNHITNWQYSFKNTAEKPDTLVFQHSEDTDSTKSDAALTSSQYLGSKSSGLILVSRDFNLFSKNSVYIEYQNQKIKCIKVARHQSQTYTIFCPTENLKIINSDIFTRGNKVFTIKLQGNFDNELKGKVYTNHIFRYGLSNIYGIAEVFDLDDVANFQQFHTGNRCYQFKQDQQNLRKYFQIHLDINDHIPLKKSGGKNEAYPSFKIDFTRQEVTHVIDMDDLIQDQALGHKVCYVENYENILSCSIEKYSTSPDRERKFIVTVNAENTEKILVQKLVINIKISDAILNQDFDSYLFTLEPKIGLPTMDSSDTNRVLFGVNYAANVFTGDLYKECSNFQLNIRNTRLKGQVESENISFQFSKVRSPTDFEMKFSLKNQLSTSEKIYIQQSDQIHITWNFLRNTRVKTKTTVYCQPYIGSKLSFDFLSFSQERDTAILLPKYDIQNVENLSIKCFGAISSENDGDTNKASIQWIFGTATTSPRSASSQSKAFEFLSETALPDLTVQLQKYNNYIGQDSEYVFQIQLTKSITPNSRFYIQFIPGISSKLQKREGAITCLIQNTWAHCEIIGERLLKIYSNQDITVADGQQQQISISVSGVTQPDWSSRLGSYQEIQVGLSLTSDETNLDYLGGLLDVSPLAYNANTDFNLISSQLDGEIFRQETSQTIYISIPQSREIGQLLTIEFFALRNSLSRSQLVCELFDADGSQSQENNLVESQCKFITQSKLQMTIKSLQQMQESINEGPKRYKIHIQNLPYPNSLNYENYSDKLNLNYQYTRYNIYFQDHETLQVKLSNIQYTGLAKKYYPKPPKNLIDLVWTTNPQKTEEFDNEINIGYISQSFYLVPKDKLPFQTSILMSLESQLQESNSEEEQEQNKIQLVIDPPQLRAYVNDMYLKLDIGAKQSQGNQIIGPVLLDFIKTGGQSYSTNVPDLYLLVTQKICEQISVPTQIQYIVSDNDYLSWPIEIDFSMCKPLQELTLKVEFEGITADVRDTQADQKIIFSQNNPELTKLKAVYEINASLVGTGFMKILIQEPNSPFKNEYKIPVEVVDQSALVTTIPDAEIIPQFQHNTHSIQIKCNINQPTDKKLTYRAYYVYHIKKGEGQKYSKEEIVEIISKNGQGIYQDSDPFQASFHYIEQTQNPTNFERLDNLKDNAQYTLYGFCQNQKGEPSPNIQSIDFSTQSNNEFLLKLNVLFESQLNQPQIRSLSCALTHILQIQRVQVVTDEFIYCDDYEASMAEKQTEPGQQQPLQPIQSRRRNLQLKQNQSQYLQQSNKEYQCNQQQQSLHSCITKSIQKNNKRVLAQGEPELYSLSTDLEQGSEPDKDTDPQDPVEEEETLYNYLYYVIPSHDYYSYSYTNDLLESLYQPNIEKTIQSHLTQQLPEIYRLQITQPSNREVPKIKSLEAYINLDTLTLTLTPSANGFIYMGLDYQISENKITHVQMLKQMNADGKSFQHYQKNFIQKNTQSLFTINQLSDDQDYELHFIISSEEPSDKAQFDPEVYTIKFKIDKKLFIPDVHANLLQNTFFMFAIIVLISIF